MNDLNRREFAKAAGMGLAAASSFYIGTPKGVAGPNDRVRHATIGIGGQGRRQSETFQNFDDCEVVAICDIDPSRLADAKKRAPNLEKCREVGDFREILDDSSIDTISIATPDHWHGPIAIMGALAGKHVYVEKPCCHNLNEGRLMVKAAKKTGKCMQHGTQSRSGRSSRAGIQALQDGIIGKVRMAKATNSQLREPIGRAEPSDPPPGVNYDLWLGPADKTPFTQNRWHYNWHWFWDLGTGDMGNDGTHQIDVARWGLGVGTPKAVSASGGQLFYDDDHQTPDTQVATFEYDDCLLMYEMRLWADYPLEGFHNGAVFYGDEGTLGIDPRRVVVHKKGEEPKQIADGDSFADHPRNFLDAVKANDPSKLTAPIETAFETVTLVHMGNIATRVGDKLHFDSEACRFTDNEEANKLISRHYREGYELPEV
ncbi:MAG: Gfo/Idh/MocA family oxidoreductase [Candidatus Omnitrophica bacterium]|nr:Gfo/Idh/MocA family oxidoreductase [Candidatus Omnitrophota bacterium]